MTPMQFLCATVLAASALPCLAGDLYLYGPTLRVFRQVEPTPGEAGQGGTSGFDWASMYRLDRLLAGYRIRPYLAIESGASNPATARLAAALGGSTASSQRLHGTNATALGGVQINESLALFGRLGMGNERRASFELPLSGSSTVFRTNNGGGATYTLSSDFGVRLEYERFKTLDDASSVRQWSIAIHWRH